MHTRSPWTLLPSFLLLPSSLFLLPAGRTSTGGGWPTEITLPTVSDKRTLPRVHPAPPDARAHCSRYPVPHGVLFSSRSVPAMTLHAHSPITRGASSSSTRLAHTRVTTRPNGTRTMDVDVDSHSRVPRTGSDWLSLSSVCLRAGRACICSSPREADAVDVRRPSTRQAESGVQG